MDGTARAERSGASAARRAFTRAPAALRALVPVMLLAPAMLAGPAGAQTGMASSLPKQAGAGSAVPGSADWYVDASAFPPGNGTPASPYTSLAAALATPALAPGDVVLVAPGVYAGPVSAPPFGVTVRASAGPGATRIDGLGAAPALVLDGTDGVPTVVEGLTLQHGAGAPVGIIFSGGGGLQAEDAVFELRDCVIERNDAFWGGGVHALNSVGVLIDCRVEFNTNTGFGARGAGILVDGGALRVERCRVAANVSGDFFAPGTGGGLYAQGAVDLDVFDSTFEDNVAELGGGGAFGIGDYVSCTLRGNQGQFGGGAQAGAGATFTDCLFEGNVADSLGGTSHFGGGLWGPGTLVDSTVRSNVAFGGAGGVEGALLLGGVVEDNLAVQGYGGVNAISGGVKSVVALDCTLARNLADGRGLYDALGGGAGLSTLVECDLESNEVRPSPGYGGGGAYGCDVRRSRLIGNRSSGRGGGVWRGSVRRSVLHDNYAEAGGGAADADLERCTLDGNQAVIGGGVYVDVGETVSVRNSIFTGNVPDQLAQGSGAALTVDYSDVQGGWLGTGNIDADPLFWIPELDNFHLLPGSPCIDVGDPLATPDPDGSVADMGAHWASPHYLPDLGKYLNEGVKP